MNLLNAYLFMIFYTQQNYIIVNAEFYLEMEQCVETSKKNINSKDNCTKYI